MPCEEHPDHSAELNRLKRIRGQIDGIGRMIEERRYCPDILIQTQAARSALRSLEKTLLEGHLRHCVSEAFQSESQGQRDAKISELLEIFAKRLPK